MKQLSLILCALHLTAMALAQRPFSRDLWLNESNTPVAVHALARDTTGYIWLGTDAGLYRFNGRSFVKITDTGNHPVTALAAQGDTVYCGYANGRIARYTSAGLVTMSFTKARPASRIIGLNIHAGILWASTGGEGIYGLINGKGYQINTRSGLSDDYVYQTTITTNGRMLAATDHGINIVSLSGGRLHIQLINVLAELHDNIVRSLMPAPDNTGCVWCGLQDGGLLCFGMEENLIWRGTPPAWRYGQINDVLTLSCDHAWIATETGYLVDCYRRDTGYELRPHYFSGKRFRKLLQDRSGNLWAATMEGITLVTDNYLSYLPMGPAYRLSDITAMACDKINCLLYAQGAVLYQCALPHPSNATMALNANAPITCLYNDDEDRLWVGTLGAGLWCREHGVIRAVKNIPGLLAGQILDICGIGNTLWVSSLNGVEEITFTDEDGTVPRRIVHHGKHTGTGSDYVYQLFRDHKGNMWMATDGAGICMYDGAHYRHWDSTSGFGSDVVYSITEDAAGRIWAATLDKGLYVYNGYRWQHIGRQQGLLDPAISTLAANSSGQVVVVHSKGIDEWYPASEQFRHYNRRLGVDIDSQSNALNCYAIDTAGNVWVPFEHGIMCLQNVPYNYDLRPGITISSVMLYLKPVPAGKWLFDAGENHLSFRFDGINFTNPERLLYRYKLQGLDNSWVSTTDESVTFPQLPAGNYTFRVQASLNPAFTSAREASYSFRIAVPIWRRWWAIMFAVLLLILAAYSYLRLRVRKLQRTSLLQRERMMAEYEQLKSQVNPHFLFNSLNTLASLIEEDGERAVHYTMQLSDLYRSMLAYKDRDLIFLTEEWALLQKYVYIQQSRFQGCLHLHADIPESIAAARQIVPLALQLLIENAIKHNIVSIAQPLHIYLSATAEAVTVRNILNPKMSKEQGEGLGLANIARRYVLLSSRPVQYGEEGNQFIVTIPLL